MKHLYNFLLSTVLLISFLFLPYQVKSNWINSTQQTPNTPHTQSDSLPGGVTNDWLNDLRDEKGKSIRTDIEPGISGEISEDPGGDALQKKIFTGLGINYSFGYSVSSAGDLNGDGYDDIVVGAYGYSSNTGRVYIYFGGLIMNTVADVVMTGESANNYFGYSVSSAGDVNGDGYSDVIVGAYGYSSNTGRAYIYFGGPSMNNTADVTITGEASNNYYGNSVSTAGDVNGDGYSDVIAGAFGYSVNTGKTYIYFGGSSMNNTADLTMAGESTDNYFGRAVSFAGDVNSDGYSDVIVSAYRYSSYTGRSYIFYGGSSMNSTADVIMTGEAINDYFGISVSSAGDVNGDGYSDVIVGAYRYSSSTGRSYIYFGGTSMNNTADVVMTGETASNYFGCSVSSAGDLNGDGFSDVIVGAYGYTSNTGRAYVYFGGTSMNNIADVIMTGEATNNNFGISVSSACDVNGDGYSDVIVGAKAYSSSTGRVYLFDYFMKNEIIPDVIMTGETTDNYFGFSVSSAGDVNGDGYSDVIVCAEGYSSNTGRAYIFFGGTSMNNIADVILTGESSNNFFGCSASSAGDINGDGYSDVIVGALGYSSSTGRAYIYFGGSSMNNVADVIMTGETVNHNFGKSVSTAGDLNGDGYSDVVVGAYTYTGKAYIYFGGSTMNNTSDITLIGEDTYNYFGSSLSSAGDVNGDGYSDLIIGSYGYSSDVGRAYIYFGGSLMDSIADITMNSEGAYYKFGRSVSGAGDVNSDGFSDVIVGSSSGRAYIFFGGSSMNNSADVTITGEIPYSYFGGSVSTAGDVNGDGYSDVIVGANEYLSKTGRVYIYFGGSSMDNTADVTMTGDSTDNYFGISTFAAGDVNGDGYSDLIAGAYKYSSSTGRSYIYLGSAISAKPILNFVKDVQNDQGGFVELKWARSSYDVNGSDLVTHYVVERSSPPSGGNFAWSNIAEIPANKNSFYSINSPTPYDSGSNSNGVFFYRITAKTSILSQYWRSGILSGRSIDNIAPLMVSPFSAEVSGQDVRLNWQRSTAPDLLNYILFRSVNPTIDPYSETPWTMGTDSTYLDTSPLSGDYYYFIIAQDIHGNYSPVAVTQSPATGIILDLTIFIQGFYHAGLNSQVSDTVSIQLRNSLAPYEIINQTKGVAVSDGTVRLYFGNAPSGNYYITVSHRNSIMTWSANAIVISNGSNSYDFSTALSQAYGNNMKQVDMTPLRFAIYSGDENQNGVVDLTDVVNVSNAGSSFTSGYVPTDMNGDNSTDLSDLVITSNNASAFVAKIGP